MCQPAMDAWMFGTPTVLSDIPPFREHEQILGIRSAYFDPMNPNDIANTFHYCLSNTDELSQNAIISKEKMEQYTWENVCRSYMNVFQKAIVNK
jgi:glycosyltransferase involved in cell wall biosynthesis